MACQDGYIGSVELWPVSWAPEMWACCMGQLISIQQNTALFSLLGTTYGGDGHTTFGLPDLRGRVPIGIGQSPGTANYSLGQKGGQEQIALSANQMPVHAHGATAAVTLMASSGRADKTSPEGSFIAGQSGVNMFAATANTCMASSPVTVTVQSAGGGTGVPIVQPYLALNYIIALSGVFPIRP